MEYARWGMGEVGCCEQIFGEKIEMVELGVMRAPAVKSAHSIDELFEIMNSNPLCYDINSLISNGVSGLLGVEAATAYWGLSSYASDEPIFLMKSSRSKSYYYQSELSFLFSKDVNTDNVVKLSDTLSVTDREQTICDMIRFDRQEFHLFETVDSAYYIGSVDTHRLEKMAKEYGIFDRLCEIREEVSKLDRI